MATFVAGGIIVFYVGLDVLTDFIMAAEIPSTISPDAIIRWFRLLIPVVVILGIAWGGYALWEKWIDFKVGED